MSEQNTVGRAPELPKYFGSKTIRATPMTLGVYNATRGWEIPSNENPHREGYYLIYEDGYVSWSPKEIFESAYRLTTGLTFGQAIEAAKQGKRVARSGWNGSGQFAYIVPAASYPAQTGAAKAHFGEGSMVPYREYWALKTAQNDVATWAPSSSDSLSEDWMILD